MSAANGDWRGANHADIYFTDEEVWALSQIDADDPSLLCGSVSIAEKEMLCQRDMRVRGRRLWNYHERVGDLGEFFPFLFDPSRDAFAVVEHGMAVIQ